MNNRETLILAKKHIYIYKTLNKMKTETLKTVLFFTILLTAIVTIHLLTPTQYR